MLALLGNFDFTELLVIGVGALLVFGRRLPEVSMRAAAQIVRLRRAVSQMWREAGIEDELRRVRREIEAEVPPVRTRAVRDKIAESFAQADPGALGPGPDSGPGRGPEHGPEHRPEHRPEPKTDSPLDGAAEGSAQPADDRESA